MGRRYPDFKGMAFVTADYSDGSPIKGVHVANQESGTFEIEREVEEDEPDGNAGDDLGDLPGFERI